MVNTSRHIEFMQACNFTATTVDLYNLSNTYIQQLLPAAFTRNLGRQLRVGSKTSVKSVSSQSGLPAAICCSIRREKAGGERKIIKKKPPEHKTQL